MVFVQNMQLVVTLTKLLPSVCASVAGSCTFILGFLQQLLYTLLMVVQLTLDLISTAIAPVQEL